MARPPEDGFTTMQYVAAVAFSLVLFLLVGNLLVDLYARGAVRDALDEAVRAGVPAGAGPIECEARAREVIASIVRGSLVRVEGLRCERDGTRVVAEAHVVLHSWIALPDWRVDLRASAEREQ
jgi:hypothetical protein